MHKQWMATMAAGVLAALCSLPAAGAQRARAEPLQELEEIVVHGKLPGPPLWKVWKDDHVLWILPLVDAYPRKMEWDSARVEALLAKSQEYITRPRVANGFSLSNPLAFFRALDLVTAMTQLPKGKTLAKVLPPDLYQRFKALKERHFPRNYLIDTQTVTEATKTLRSEVLEHENLERFYNNGTYSPAPIMSKLNPWLRANKSVRSVWIETGAMRHFTRKEFKVAAVALEEAMKSPAFNSWAVGCMEETIGYLEKNLEPLKRQANAWARGHVEGLVTPTPGFEEGNACRETPLASLLGEKLRKKHPEVLAALTPDTQALMRTSKSRWLAAAESALERNTTTFSMLALHDILDKDGLVEQLKAKGYSVEVSID